MFVNKNLIIDDYGVSLGKCSQRITVKKDRKIKEEMPLIWIKKITLFLGKG